MNIHEYITSGIIENYVMGFTSAEENLLVESLIRKNALFRKEIEQYQTALNFYMLGFSKNPPSHLRLKILHKIRLLEEE